MTLGDWIFTLTGIAAGSLGVATLAWSLLGDRFRTRADRRTGTLRRCPECWYDLRAVAGLRCPECGHEAKGEQRLTRTRSHWRYAALAVLVVLLGAGLAVYPHSTGGAWHRWLPDSLVIELLPYTTDDHWAAEEMMRRLGQGSPLGSPPVETPGRLSARQWRRLNNRCIETLSETGWSLGARSEESLLVYQSPFPAMGYGLLMSWAESNDFKTREAANLDLSRIRFSLSDAQLDEAWNTLRDTWNSDNQANKWAYEFTEKLEAQRSARRSAEYNAEVRAVESMEITPDRVVDALDGSSVSELFTLYRRLGLARGPLVDAADLHPDAIEVERLDLHLDDDDSLDCVLLVSNRDWERDGSRTHYDALVLLQRPRGWELAARLKLTNCLDGPPEFRSYAGPDGRRWFMVRKVGGSSGDGSYFIMLDAWYRLRSNGLVTEQTLYSSGYLQSPFEVTLRTNEPTIVRDHGRPAARYEQTATVGLSVLHADGSRTSVPLAERSGTFTYPLGVADAAMGRHVAPGPWGGQDAWWAILGDPNETLAASKDQLLALAASDDAAARESLRAALALIEDRSGDTAELAAVRGALDARDSLDNPESRADPGG